MRTSDDYNAIRANERHWTDWLGVRAALNEGRSSFLHLESAPTTHRFLNAIR
jgi:hypothetical protein